MKAHLRKIALSDTSNIVKWRNSEEVRKNLFTQDDLTEEQHINWFHNKVETGLCAQYIIEVIEENASHDIGTTFIKNIDNNKKEGEFGIFIGEASFRGKHLSTAATKEMIRIGFEELGLTLIYLSVFADNVPAIMAYEKVGFCKLQEMKEKKNGRSVILMSIAINQFKR